MPTTKDIRKRAQNWHDFLVCSWLFENYQFSYQNIIMYTSMLPYLMYLSLLYPHKIYKNNILKIFIINNSILLRWEQTSIKKLK